MQRITPGTENAADHLRVVLATRKIGIWDLDLRTGHAWRNSRHDEIFGFPAPLPDWTYEQFLTHVVEADRERVDILQRGAISAGEPWSFECRITRADGEVRWISVHGEPLFDDAGVPVKLIGHVLDISSIKETEERLRLVTHELNHRISNFSSMVLSLINMSSRSGDSIRDVATALSGRVRALARTLAIHEDQDKGTVRIADFISEEIAPFNLTDIRIVANLDEDIHLKGKTAQSLLLMIHELITNACKYGALSNDAGIVDMALKRLPAGNIGLSWSESGGPPVTEPARTGFGSKLIRSVLGAGADVDIAYAPEGLRCEITLHHSPEPAMRR